MPRGMTRTRTGEGTWITVAKATADCDVGLVWSYIHEYCNYFQIQQLIYAMRSW